ncbi:glycoside hydrolase family 71 protein [Polychaeton citri CBS 116435]|uniref:Glycoside hydrolase family 71 protein n=1 Tax=Polychaeton citri CBS 116435 TaxID=1314669 RepID=A0A9P4UK33_9PEZI|nr:glycoside hydrolase family 71 protein [Polychaeton citri CBS 116435]
MAASIASFVVFIIGLLPTLITAQAAFAHVIVGNTGAYDINQWKSDIQLAAQYGIDGFVLNIAPPFSGSTSTQMSYAFQAANALSSLNFKMFFSFDYLGGGQPWASSDIITILKAYGPNGAHYQVNGKPMVSTFEGTSNINDWNSIRSSVPGGIYFVPDWTSLGPNGFSSSIVDGAFSWDMWPNGPNNISTSSDQAWENFLKPAGKSYMMGVSPWFYTDLPGYNKAWVWRGDDMWYRRWQQTLDILPDFVEIVTWNDFGESHYIGPIYASGIPSASNADARPYVNGFPHQAWLATLPYQIAAYKHAKNSAKPAPSVPAGGDKVVFWYRTAPASAGSTDATGNDCKSSINTGGYQTCYPIPQMLEDGVFAIVLVANSATATIKIGSNAATTFTGLKPGINFISRPFNGQLGAVTVSVSSGASATGPAIVSSPSSGKANYNAWAGCAGSC